MERCRVAAEKMVEAVEEEEEEEEVASNSGLMAFWGMCLPSRVVSPSARMCIWPIGSWTLKIWAGGAGLSYRANTRVWWRMSSSTKSMMSLLSESTFMGSLLSDLVTVGAQQTAMFLGDILLTVSKEASLARKWNT